MRTPTASGSRRRRGGRSLWTAVALLTACARPQQETRAPPTPWDTSSVFLRSETAADEELDRLRRAAEEASASAEIARLSRLYDLFDCARFTQNALVRDVLWRATGLPTIRARRGRAATLAILESLLEAAWRIEATYPELTEEQRSFLADFVALVSVDMFAPEDLDTLQIQTDAFHRIARTGAYVLRDNAYWRIYDHVRAVIRATNTAPVERRWFLGVHTLYGGERDPELWLAAPTDHRRPPWPSASKILEPLERAHAAIAAREEWRESMEVVRAADEPLVETFRASYPSPRDPTLPLLEVAVGTGRPDDGRPLFWIGADGWFVNQDYGPQETLPWTTTNDELTRRMSAELARDGRGRLLVGSAGKSPSPTLAVAMKAARESGAVEVGFPMHEPAEQDGRPVLTTLSVRRLDATTPTPGTAALRASPLEMRLSGRGLSVYVHGKQVATGLASDAYGGLMRVLHHAYPRVKVARLRLGHDAMYVQVVDLLRALLGGMDPLFEAIGLEDSEVSETDITTPSPRELRTRWNALEERATLGRSKLTEIEQPYPLREIDQPSVTAVGTSLSSCLPELARAPRRGLQVTLTVDEGHVHTIESRRDGRAVPKDSDFHICVREVTTGTRLRAHRERIELRYIWRPEDFTGEPPIEN